MLRVRLHLSFQYGCDICSVMGKTQTKTSGKQYVTYCECIDVRKASLTFIHVPYGLCTVPAKMLCMLQSHRSNIAGVFCA